MVYSRKNMKRASVSFDQSQAVDGLKVKYQTLLKEYLELQKEYVGTKRKLQAANQRKETVLAEVRFLRRRRNFLVKISECNVEDPLHRPSSDLQINALEGGNHQTMTESLDQVCVKQIFANNEEGKRQDFENLRIPKKSSNSSVHDEGIGKGKITRPSQVTVKSNSVAFGQ